MFFVCKELRTRRRFRFCTPWGHHSFNFHFFSLFFFSWKTELDKSSSSITIFTWLDQFSFLGNRALYEFIELDMSTGLDMSIPRSRPLTFPGGQSKDGYRGRWLIELGFSREEKKRKKMEIKAMMTSWSTKSKTPSRSQFLTDKKHCFPVNGTNS